MIKYNSDLRHGCGFIFVYHVITDTNILRKLDKNGTNIFWEMSIGFRNPAAKFWIADSKEDYYEKETGIYAGCNYDSQRSIDRMRQCVG